ncbi:unnamed protein product [Rhizophagus irregularis]|nr:unnamed protein product [Rhizophagus irregularis]
MDQTPAPSVVTNIKTSSSSHIGNRKSLKKLVLSMKRLPARPLPPMKSQIESRDSNEEEEDNKKKRKKKAAITRADVDRFRLEVNVTTNKDS